nr:FKBP-type peptidyl-prolyl cis-trans isomerase [uncultured Algibacter sp.]
MNYATENDEQIQAYLTENNITAEKTESGLYYVTDGLGEGKQPTITDNVTVAYKGYFTDDNFFDEGSENISFDLQNLIEGFSKGLTYFKEGDSGNLYIPSHLAYGNNGRSGIPGGAVLIFDVELISVN